MIKIKSLAVLALLLLLILGTACQRQPENPGQNAIPASTGEDSARHIRRQLDNNLSVDAEVSAPPSMQKLDSLLVAPYRLDTQEQALKALVIGNSKITQTTEPNSRGGNKSFRTADEKMLVVGSKFVYFETANFQPYIRQILFRYITPGDTTYNLDRFRENIDRDLPFMPYRQAEDEVKKALVSLGITVYEEVETYALDYQTLQAQEQVMKEKGDLTSPKDGSIMLKDHWSEEDDTYYMIFRGSIDNIPVYPLEHGNVESNTLVEGNNIEAAYSQRGLEYLTIYSPYQKKSVDQEDLTIIGVEEALAAVKRKYSNIILTDPTTITGIKFYYVPTLINRSRDEFRMVPAWTFELEQVRKNDKGEQIASHSRIIIDASTGGEIL